MSTSKQLVLGPMESLISIAIMPPEDITAIVAGLKNELAQVIGNYRSRNSDAHITLAGMPVDVIKRDRIDRIIADVCHKMSAVTVRLDTFNTYPQGTVYLGPDDHSRVSLMQILHILKKTLKKSGMVHISGDPHLTIGRELDADRLEKAVALFHDRGLELNFICDHIAIRVFDEERRQYLVNKRFYFEGQGGMIFSEQITLF